jgi:hypothetical protein
MVPTGVLIGQITMVFATTLLGIWSATQWTAAALEYQVRLGAPWFDLFGTPIYHPWRLFEWWYFFDAYAPDIFLRGGADDWTGLAIPAPAAPSPGLVSPAHGESIDDGGQQQQPELSEIIFTPEPEHVVDDLGLFDDDDLSLPTQLDPRLQRTARLAALDPDDGISL